MTLDDNVGVLKVNGADQQRGISPGSEVELDTGDAIYLGGIDHFEKTTYDTGYTGIVKTVKINDKIVDFGAEATIIKVFEADVCLPDTCLHKGRCEPTHNRDGYRCMCVDGYTGQHCERRNHKCRNGNECAAGRCVDLPDHNHRCICPLNRGGARCENTIEFQSTRPMFDGQDSYIEVESPVSVLAENAQVLLRVKPAGDVKNAVLAYMPESTISHGDYMAIVIENGNIKLKYNSGDGSKEIVSQQRFGADDWVDIKVERTDGKTKLIVNGAIVENREPYDSFDQLDSTISISGSIAIGGHAPGALLPSSIVALPAFQGCIESPIRINNQAISLIDNIRSSGAIQACDAIVTTTQQAIAIVTSTESSRHSTQPPIGCRSDNYCLHDGRCVSNECVCIYPHYGDTCSNELAHDSSLHFDGTAFLALHESALEHLSSYVGEHIHFEFKTNKSDALIMYQSMHSGVNENAYPEQKDFFSFTLRDSRLVFEFALGEINSIVQPATVTDHSTLDDNQWHHVHVIRKGKTASLEVDGRAQNRVQASGLLALLDAKGPIYIGGIPRATDNGMPSTIQNYLQSEKYYNERYYGQNFVGCIRDVMMYLETEPEQNRLNLDLNKYAIDSRNVGSCADSDLMPNRKWLYMKYYYSYYRSQ